MDPKTDEQLPVVDSPKTVKQLKKEVHEQKNKERADAINALKLSYKKIRDEPAFKDMLEHGKHMADMHTRLAKDGVGYQANGGTDLGGNPQEGLVYFTNNKRVSELDRAAGMEELLGYVERMAKDVIAPVEPEKPVA